MNYLEYNSEEEKELALVQKKKREKQQKILIVFLLVGAVAYYFLIHLANKRKEAKEEIEEELRTNPLVKIDSLDNNLWEKKDSWEQHLSSLYLSAQINLFVKNIKVAIASKSEEEKDKPRKRREEEIKAVKEFLEEEEEELPEIKKSLKECIKKINQTAIDDLSTPSQEFANFVQEKRDRRKRLYWKLPAHNWADKWIARNRQSFNSVWDRMKDPDTKKEASYFDAKAIYKIFFPSSLWNQLSEKEKELAKRNGHSELKLKPDVWSYEFSELIQEWRKKVVSKPVRGEYNPDQPDVLDNNALFYGAPRTGKSIMAEIITHEANCYPLVVIQGSTLTPSKINEANGVTLLQKFFFTISSISYDLVDDYGFERETDGEVRYILFLDEADQVCTTNLLPPNQVSSQLTFLKECMGSDDKAEESKNLWIAATNHLDSINIAIYQSGRLSNPLDFSWTLAIFNRYADKAGISYQFPHHWRETTTLSAEDNKWVNRFNKIIFDKDFLGKDKYGQINPNESFWHKFINNSDTRKELNEEKETNEQGEEIIKKKGIQWGEFFEFFWQLYDSKQLRAFDGRWEKPRKPTIEEVVEENVKSAANKISTDISKAIETRLNELNDTAKETKNEIEVGQENIRAAISQSIETVTGMLAEISSRVN